MDKNILKYHNIFITVKVKGNYLFLEVRKLIKLPPSIVIISRSSDAISIKREKHHINFNLLQKINSCFLNDWSNSIETKSVVKNSCL